MNTLIGLLLVIGIIIIVSFILRSIGKIFKYILPIAAVVVAVIWILSSLLGSDWYDISKDAGKNVIKNKEVYYEKVKENVSEDNLKKGINFVEAELDTNKRK